MTNKKLGSDVVVMQSGHVVDVFWGHEGWGPHARFLIRNTHKGKFMNQCAGAVVPPGVVSEVMKKVGL